MKLYKNYTKEPFLLLINDTILTSDSPLRFKKILFKMSVGEKIKAINNKIKQSKVQYTLDEQTAKISALSSRNVSKYKFLTGKDVLPEKKLARKRCCIEKM